MSLDAEDIEEALESAATAHMRFDGPSSRRNHISHGARAIRVFRRALQRFMADMPADATVEELRDALADRGAEDAEDVEG